MTVPPLLPVLIAAEFPGTANTSGERYFPATDEAGARTAVNLLLLGREAQVQRDGMSLFAQVADDGREVRAVLAKRLLCATQRDLRGAQFRENGAEVAHGSQTFPQAQRICTNVRAGPCSNTRV